MACRQNHDMVAWGNLMPLKKQVLDLAAFNKSANLPFSLRLKDFDAAMQDVYDFFYDVNKLLLGKGLHRLDDMLRPAAMSGMLSDMLTASMAKHSRVLVENKHFNGHPDLVVQGRYANNSTVSGTDGVEIKSTRKKAAPSIRTADAINGCACSSTPLITRQSQRRIARR
jgi:hypothetical protein